MTQSTLDDLRAEIDRLDRQIVRLLAERAAVVGRIGERKRELGYNDDEVRSLDRVERVVDRVRGLAAAQGADPSIVEHTYRALIHALTEAQLKQLGRG